MTAHNDMQGQIEYQNDAPLWAQAMQASLEQLSAQMGEMHAQMRQMLGETQQTLDSMPQTTAILQRMDSRTRTLNDGMRGLRIEDSHLPKDANQVQASNQAMNASLLYHKRTHDLNAEREHARKHNKLVHPYDLPYIPLRILGPLTSGQVPAFVQVPVVFPQNRAHLHKLTTSDLAALLEAYDQPVPLVFEDRQQAFGTFIGVDNIHLQVQYHPFIWQ